MSLRSRKPKTFSRLGWLGLGLIVVCWTLNWMSPGLRTSIFFFPLWMGYILFMDGLVFWRRGDSLASRSGKRFARLFLVSIPAWWLFELMNLRTRNWEYLGREYIADIPYFILSSICFSTVMPAVFETAEWVRSFHWIGRICADRPPAAVEASGAARLGAIAAGAAMIALTLLWPEYFYPLVWGGFFLVLDPVNNWLGRPSLLAELCAGQWRPLMCLSFGALICGFFWEMWNYHSYPKWIYHTPGVGAPRIFEMPLPGYLGYAPFGWELYALSHFLWRGAPELRL